jgi:hypothetical protein
MGGRLTEAIAQIVALWLLSGPGILAAQVVHWIRTSRWPRLQLGDIVQLPHIAWLSESEVVHCLLAMPLSLGLLISSLILLALISLVEEAERRPSE